MKFSILIPTYNGEKFIEEAILSVLSQTRPADEIIVSDDNSSDKTVEICSKYADRVKIVVNKNGPSGFVQGWNNAIAQAKFEYVSILHQDDRLMPNFLQEAEYAFTKYPEAGHFFVPCEYIDENGVVKRKTLNKESGLRKFSKVEYVKSYIYDGCPHIHRCPGVVTKKELFTKCSYRVEAGHIADDDFFYRIGNYTEIVGLLKHLAQYREHSQSETGHLKEFEMIKRMIHDYTFQINNINDNPLFDKDCRSFFFSCLLDFTQKELLYAIRKNDKDAFILYQKDKNKLKSLRLKLKPKYYIYDIFTRCLGVTVFHYVTWIRYGAKRALFKKITDVILNIKS